LSAKGPEKKSHPRGKPLQSLGKTILMRPVSHQSGLPLI